jgi:Asp-tRNA(Asn)/Glu-tRNA(Gln) amidotransferase A subunit family amidase
LTFSEWQTMWREDRSAWRAAIVDRPARFDRKNWQRAVRIWWNDLPPEGDTVRPLSGVPFLAKDLYDVAGEVTGCSSRVMLEEVNPPPAREDSAFVRRFRDAGAHPVGRSQMNEFAYGLDGRNDHTGDCPHPLDDHRVSGGSSSGSAWAVAAGVVPVALGTDTGGSVRVPAALCGILGFRAGWSDDLLQGVFPLVPTFDTVGWFTANPTDMITALREFIPGIGDGVDREKTDGDAHRETTDGSIFWYYVPPEIAMEPELEKTIQRWIDAMNDRSGDALRIVPAPSQWVSRVRSAMGMAVDAYNVIGSHSAWKVHELWLDRYRTSYNPSVWKLIDRGRHWTEARLRQAEEAAAEVDALVREAFRDADGLLLPATPVASPTADEVDGALRETILRLNAPGSIARVPALSMPVALDAVRSGGLQALVPAGTEARLLPFLETLAAHALRSEG